MQWRLKLKEKVPFPPFCQPPIVAILFSCSVLYKIKGAQYQMASSLCSSSHDWTAYGLVIGPSRCEWIRTDSKHIESYWGDVRKEEIFIDIYNAKPGDLVWSRANDIIDTASILNAYKDFKENPQVEFKWWIDDDDFELCCLQNFEFPEVLTREELSLEYLTRTAPFQIKTA